MDSTQIEDPLEQITAFLKNINIDAVTEKPMRYLAVEQIVNSTQLIPLESKRSFSELFNP